MPNLTAMIARHKAEQHGDDDDCTETAHSQTEHFCPECGGRVYPTSGCWLCHSCGYSPCK